MSNSLTKEQYEATLKDPVAFHKCILNDPYPLSDNQKKIMSAIGSYMEVIAIAGSGAGKSWPTCGIGGSLLDIDDSFAVDVSELNVVWKTIAPRLTRSA
jgi:hypothetical protein